MSLFSLYHRQVEFLQETIIIPRRLSFPFRQIGDSILYPMNYYNVHKRNNTSRHEIIIQQQATAVLTYIPQKVENIHSQFTSYFFLYCIIIIFVVIAAAILTHSAGTE